MKRSLFELLKENSRGGRAPFHMPGHSRHTGEEYLLGLGAGLDITEIDGFDDLHDAEGILRESMDLCARTFGAERSFYHINGSTGAIYAAVWAAAGRGGSVIMARNCHKAVYRVCELLDISPRFFLPPSKDGISGPPDPEDIRRLLEKSPAKLCVITSPTYEGLTADVSAIADICHAHGTALLVDAAHGAHLGFSEKFPASAVSRKADYVVQSLHKTLPSLTQTAVLHLCGPLADENRADLGSQLFQTSSPSYLLMASIDGCVRLMAERGRELAEDWAEKMKRFRMKLRPGYLRLLEAPGMDPGKITVLTREAGLTGFRLAELLRERGIEPEMSAPCHVVLMTGMFTKESDLEKLSAALEEIGEKRWGDPLPELPALPELPEAVLPMGRALVMTSEEALPREGDISGGYIWMYPPGIPLLAPGEAVDARWLSHFEMLSASGAELKGVHGGKIKRVICL